MGASELGRGRVVSLRASALALSAVFWGCSGDAFRLAELDVEADGSTQSEFSGVVPHTSGDPATQPDSGPGAVSSGNQDAGREDAAPPVLPPVEPSGSCGTLRSENPGSNDGEVCIPAGSFDMGSTAPSLGTGYVGHGPEHAVTLSAYVLDAYEVTVARYRACVEAGECAVPSTAIGQGCTYTSAADARELYPITCVDWQQARDFCAWDGGRRLPTEAEWERAARGPGAMDYPWGETFDCSLAVVAGPSRCSEHEGTSPKAVGSTPAGASAEGAHDLAGNASEWVSDWFGAYPSGAVTDPTGPAAGSTRVQRGGNWQTRAGDAVGYARRTESPLAVGPFSFRCARNAAP